MKQKSTFATVYRTSKEFSNHTLQLRQSARRLKTVFVRFPQYITAIHRKCQWDKTADYTMPAQLLSPRIT